MLIRFDGAARGIEEYLIHGHKSGREMSRDELDQRIPLYGDLELHKSIVDGIYEREDNHKDRYLHITLAFKEDHIELETLKAITDEFKDYIMAAYQEDEYHFYAEAHLPKIKSYADKRTGEPIERKPHIHITIPKINLLTQERFEPIGYFKNNVKYFEAIQEHLNHKYGLASPKDNPRLMFNSQSEMLARVKADEFKGNHAELRKSLLDTLLERNITDWEDFKAAVSEHGLLRIRNEGQQNEYLNVKGKDWEKGANLKEQVFRREFIELPTQKKIAALHGFIEKTYVAAEQKKSNPIHIQKNIQEWISYKAQEVKHINSGNKKLYQAYQNANPSERLHILSQREHAYQMKLKSMPYGKGLTTDPYIDANHQLGRKINQADLEIGDKKGHPIINPIDGLWVGLNEEKKQEKEQSKDTWDIIKRELNGQQLLLRLSHSHGVIPEKYPVVEGHDGSPRIQCGNRKLNVSDFLTKELHLSWNEAASILKDEYKQQREQGLEQHLPAKDPSMTLWKEFKVYYKETARSEKRIAWIIQKDSEISRRSLIKSDYKGKKQHLIETSKSMPVIERKAQRSLLAIEKVMQEQSLRKVIAEERQTLKNNSTEFNSEGYKKWLQEMAEKGRVDALAELRRIRDKEVEDTGNVIKGTVLTKNVLGIEGFNYQVNSRGDVSYQKAHKELFVDKGQCIIVHRESAHTAVAMALLLSMQKWGSKLELTGSDSFKAQCVEVAVEQGMKIEFTDHKLMSLMHEKRSELITIREQQELLNHVSPKNDLTKPDMDR
jgi:hypothetical protein